MGQCLCRILLPATSLLTISYPYVKSSGTGKYKLYDLNLITEYLNYPLRPEDLSFIHKMSLQSPGLASRKHAPAVALVCVKDGSEGFELFGNFLASAMLNAPDFAHKKLIVAAFDEKIATSCRYKGFKNVLKIHGGDSFHLLRTQLVHTLLSHNISVLLLSVDQVILSDPMAYLEGDADLEISKYFSILKYNF